MTIAADGHIGATDALAPQQRGSMLLTFFFCDLLGSTDLKSRLTTAGYLPTLQRHDALLRQAIASVEGGWIQQDTGDGCMAIFPTASDAVRVALTFQSLMAQEPWPDAAKLVSRIGIHVGEVAQTNVRQDGGLKLVGLTVDLAARVMSLATGGQILMTREAFNSARQFVASHPNPPDDGAPPPIRWLAHGAYVFKGIDEPIDVFEVGVDGVAPLTPPPDSSKASRSIRPGEEPTLGWRPAVGRELERQPNWKLIEKLGEGGFGEVWLAEHAKTRARRVFKFCFDPDRLRALKREVMLFRLLREALGDRRDIACIIDWQFDAAPYFIEMEYCPRGSLTTWVESCGGLAAVPMAVRLMLVQQVAEALSAAHAIGVLHKDIKPSNVLIGTEPDLETPFARLTDFGIGILTRREQLQLYNVTAAETLNLTDNDSSRTGTRMYAPPESLTNRPHTVQGDIYALGVMLYQMAVGELSRPLAAGWERLVDDEIIRGDIADCVDGDPDRRIASARELADRLKSMEARRQAMVDHRHGEAMARRRARATRVLALVAAVLALALGVGIWSYAQIRSARDDAVLARNMAQTESDRAVRSETDARQQRDRADELRRHAEQALADRAIAQIDALAASGQWHAARQAIREVQPVFEQANRSQLPLELRLWRTYHAGPPPLIRFERPGTTCMALSSDGRRCATGHLDGSIAIWDVLTGQQTATLTLQKIPVPASVQRLNPWTIHRLNFGPDGQTLLAGGKDLRVTLWDLKTNAIRHQLGGQQNSIYAQAISPDGLSAVTGGWSKELRAWDLKAGEPTWFKPHAKNPVRANVADIAYSADGKRVAVAYRGGEGAVILDAATGEVIREFKGVQFTSLWCVAASTIDPALFAIGGEDGAIRMVSSNAATPLQVFKPGASAVRHLAFLPDDRALACLSLDGTLRQLDPQTGAEFRLFPAAPPAGSGLFVAAAGRVAACVGPLGAEIHMLATTAADLPVPDMASGLPRRDCVISPSGRLAAIAGGGGVQIIDVATGQVLHTVRSGFERHPYLEMQIPVAFNADETEVVWGDDQWLSTMDLSSGTVRRTDVRDRGRVIGLSRDARLVAIANDAAKLTVIANRVNLAEMRRFPAEHLAIRATFAHDSRAVVVATDATRREKLIVFGQWVDYNGYDFALYDFNSEGLNRRTRIDNARANTFDLHPDGRRALVPVAGSGTQVWDLQQTLRTSAATDMPNAESSACFLGRDGEVFVSAVDGVRFWRTDGGPCLAIHDAPLTNCQSIAVSDEGRYLMIAGRTQRGHHAYIRDLWRHRLFGELESYRPGIASGTASPGTKSATSTAPASPTGHSPHALLRRGQWFALQGMHDWAAEMLTRPDSDDRPPLLLRARCLWLAGHLAASSAEFNRMIAARSDASGPDNAEVRYLKLCRQAVDRRRKSE